MRFLSAGSRVCFQTPRHESPDLMTADGKMLTDGAGKMSKQVADEVASDLGMAAWYGSLVGAW